MFRFAFFVFALAFTVPAFAQQDGSVKGAKTTPALNELKKQTEALEKLVKVLREHEMAEMDRHLGMVKDEFAGYTIYAQKRAMLTSALKKALAEENERVTQALMDELFQNKLNINSASSLLRTWGRDLLSNIHSNLTAGALTEREAEMVVREYEGIKMRATTVVPEELLQLVEAAKAKYPSQAANFDIYWESYSPFREAFR